MKRSFYSFIFVFVFQFALLAQVPNAGFENWTAGNPDGWLTNNSVGTFVTITQSNSSHSGSSAVKGQVEAYEGFVFSPILFSTNEDGAGFPVSTRYNSLKGFFKYDPIEGDIFHVQIVMIFNTEAIGVGTFQSATTIADYAEVNIPIQYLTSDVPDSAIIFMTILGPTGADYHVGSEFYADDLSLSTAVVGVEDNQLQPALFKLEQNYPNPFNPSTVINYSVPARSFVTMKVYNILGNEVASLINETKEAGRYSIKFDASTLPSGVYIYSINAGNFTSSKKMILTK